MKVTWQTSDDFGSYLFCHGCGWSKVHQEAYVIEIDNEHWVRLCVACWNDLTTLVESVRNVRPE